jgi:hypothetical protein
MARSRVELFEQIRRDRRAGGYSIRELAARHHVHRRTVRQALASAVPPPRKAYQQRPRPTIGPYAAVGDQWLPRSRPRRAARPGSACHREFAVPVIGVAKPAFRTATHTIAVLRGTSCRLNKHRSPPEDLRHGQRQITMSIR